MKAILISLVVASAAAWAQTTLAPPQAGFIEDGANSFRPVYGIAGNFLLGDPAGAGIVSAAFSGSFGLAKTDSSLLVTDRNGKLIASQDAPQGPAFFAFSSDGSPALAYFPNKNLLLLWNGGGFQLVLFDWNAFPASAVRSIALPDPYHVSAIIQRDDGLWDVRMLLATGEVDSRAALPGVNAPALMLPTADLVYAGATGLVVRRLDGTETRIDAQLPANFSLQQMGDGWVQVRDLDGCPQLALRVTPSREGLFVLPGEDQ
jgi:hypothetical protein